MSLNVIRDIAHRIGTAHGFNESTFGDDVALIHSELSEALEDFRNGRPLAETRYQDGSMFVEKNPSGKLKPVGIPSELADVVIRCAHLAGKHNIDLDAALLLAQPEPNDYFGEKTFAEGLGLIHSVVATMTTLSSKGYHPAQIVSDPGVIENIPFLGIPLSLVITIRLTYLFAEKHGIDLASAIVEKTAYNGSRPFKHGGKKI